MVNTDIPFLLTLRKLETQTFEGLVIFQNFMYDAYLWNLAIFQFFHNGYTDIPLILKKLEIQILRGQ